MSDKIVYPTIDTFETEVMNSDLPVLVDFYADWCGPCQTLAPTVESLAEKYDGKIKICKINVDQAQQLAIAHKIMSIPTLLFVKDGEIKERLLGAYPEEVLTQKLDAML